MVTFLYLYQLRLRNRDRRLAKVTLTTISYVVTTYILHRNITHLLACAMAVGRTRLVLRFIYEKGISSCRRGPTDDLAEDGLATAMSCQRMKAEAPKEGRFRAIEKVVKIFHLRSCEPLPSLARHKPHLYESLFYAFEYDLILLSPSRCII